jgi:predicted metal-dependent phosphoesterase TrpH
LQEKINPGLSVAETIAAIREQGGLAIAPHPFVRLARGDRLGSAFLKNASLFDIVEVRNSNNPIASDCQKALDYSLAHGMPTLAGSDAHHLSGVGSARNFLPTFTTPTEFLSAVRKAHFMASCHPARYFARMILNQIRIRL